MQLCDCLQKGSSICIAAIQHGNEVGCWETELMQALMQLRIRPADARTGLAGPGPPAHGLLQALKPGVSRLHCGCSRLSAEGGVLG